MRSANISHAYTHLIGIDEAGRGPLAGPVVVAGVKITCRTDTQALFKHIRDSKQLTSRRRATWFAFLTVHPAIKWATASVTPKVIDRINIYQAAQLGAWRVYKKLSKNDSAHVLLDGSLFLPKFVSQETIVRGDASVPLIGAASIIAKVVRDRMMLRLHRKYPDYCFNLHKGYGTALHRSLIIRFGPCAIHRKSFSMASNRNLRKTRGIR